MLQTSSGGRREISTRAPRRQTSFASKPVAAAVGPIWDGWADALFRSFVSGTQRDRIAALDHLRNPSTWRDRAAERAFTIAALERATAPGGRLAFTPEAHVALGSLYADAGRTSEAEARLWAGVRRVGGYSPDGKSVGGAPVIRRRAALVNYVASQAFVKTGNAFQRDARREISIQFGATDEDRAAERAMPRTSPFDPKSRRGAATNGSGRSKPPAKPKVAKPTPAGSRSEPEVSAIGGELDVVAVYRAAAEWSKYYRTLEAWTRKANGVGVPARPDEVRHTRVLYEFARRSPDPECRRLAPDLLYAHGFEHELELARAYWGLP